MSRTRFTASWVLFRRKLTPTAPVHFGIEVKKHLAITRYSSALASYSGGEIRPRRAWATLKALKNEGRMPEILLERSVCFEVGAEPHDINQQFPYLMPVLALNEFKDEFTEPFITASLPDGATHMWKQQLYSFARASQPDHSKVVSLLFGRDEAKLWKHEAVIFPDLAPALIAPEPKSPPTEIAGFGDWA